ncbi:cleavage and polyadenylation specificity factor subunit 3 [Labeo rohita]|uniref:Cleavage and polyadenylation specificity factor subunit 3 n=1 Tax=Labeo rohita TaxID=84645 RepID=A0A498LL87_LABRO|nr:cleavage and polyadenylation specificity factor subunit 3 [Labeo rohita]
MAAKRKADVPVPAEESDQLLIRPLGAGQEVGRSCIILEFKGRKIMLDCGIHPGLEGMDALPYIDLIDPAEIDLLLISHFHLDHCGALPWFLQKTSFKGRTFMTHATKAIYRWLLSDYVKVSNISADDMLYTETDLEESMDKIETINFHEVKEVAGIKFWCYHAGHVLGAAMFMIEIAGVKLLYTGDFSRQEDRHLMAAEIPSVKPDILITESTYGTHIHEKREEREARFCNTVHDIVNREGRCLIPVFALGRAQELLLILDEYWQNHPELHDIPIYYASSLAKKCMAVYQTYVNAMNDKIRKAININNPFVFKHISNLKSMDHFDDIGPSVVMASPGMMQSGLSRELFESWCTDKRNGVIIAGYCVEGTLAKHIMSEPEEITTMSGQKLPLKMSVDYISFSAHTDYQQTSEFIRALKPPHVILVHGEQNEMARLKAALIREYEDNDEVHIEVHNPRNTEAVTLNFRGEKLAKVMGCLADKKCAQGQRVSGILVKKNFSYHILAPSDLSNYTDLAMSTVKQTQAIPFTGPFPLLLSQLRHLTGDVEEIEISEKSTLRVFNSITVNHDQNMVMLEWFANPLNDMYADAVTTVVLEILVHGEQNEMARLKAALIREYEDNDEVHIEVHNPRNTEAVTLNFRGEKLAKVMGCLADKKCAQGQRVSGILVKKNFSYHILAPSDLSNYTDLAMSTVKQTQAIPFTGPFPLLLSQLRHLTGDVEEIEISEKSTLRVFNSITVNHDQNMVMLEWFANPLNDMYADAVTTVVLEVQSNPKAQKVVQPQEKKVDVNVFQNRLLKMFQDMFGEECVDFKDKNCLAVCVDGKTAFINLETRTVECEEANSEDDSLREMVELSVQRLYEAMNPVM